MALVNNKALRQARMEIAVRMCIEHSHLLEQALSDYPAEYFATFAKDRDVQVTILRELMKADYVVRATLKYYAKREEL